MPIFPPALDDTFSGLTETFDEARQILVDEGIRTYRVWLYLEMWDQEAFSGDPELIVTEVTPSPEVRWASTRREAEMQGLNEESAVVLTEISRAFTYEQLRGKTVNGDDLPERMRFHYALAPLGAKRVRLYVPAGDPILDATEWRIQLRPVNETRPMPLS